MWSVIGQSAGGWAAPSHCSSQKPAGRPGDHHLCRGGAAGRVGRQSPTTIAHPTKLVEATGRIRPLRARSNAVDLRRERTPSSDPLLSKRMHDAYTNAGGKAEYHMLPPFGSDGHFLIGSAESLPMWTPLVSRVSGKGIDIQEA